MIVVGVDSTVRIRDFTQTDWAETRFADPDRESYARHAKQMHDRPSEASERMPNE